MMAGAVTVEVTVAAEVMAEGAVVETKSRFVQQRKSLKKVRERVIVFACEE